MRRSVDVKWFSNSTGTVGIVKVQDSITGKFKYYIGAGKGVDEGFDSKYIAEWGSHFPLEAAIAIFGAEQND